ncbi:MAG: type II secretion system F family protein [Planctomycetes bacterium]|nr:type II secretion system F family protein [Planctomycetota bacterium]MBL7042969.1 type II secretion system F family protein [Pirellulaceae bacterium]
MPDFAYIARNGKGERVSGSLSAGSEREVIALLSGDSLFPVEVTPEKPKGKGVSRKRISGQLMATTYSQLASLIRSGVPLLRSLNVIQHQTSNARLKEVMEDVHRRVEDGATLADAMNRYPRVFNEMAINMTRAGAEGGFMEDALDRVSKFTEQQEDLKSRTAGALAYPIFLAVVGTVVVGGLIIFFVPMFSSMFDSLRDRGELPVLTDWLLWFSDTIRGYGLFLLVPALVVGIVLQRQLQTDRGKRIRDLIKLRLPLLGIVFTNLAVARFCRVLGTLLANGVPILKSLEISRETTGNKVLSEAIAKASENISSGQSLAAPLAKCEHFPLTVVEMISVAEESNTLDEVLVEISDGLERRTARRLDLVVRLLEPVMLLMLAIVVLCVVIALLMPVLKMSSIMR